VINYSIQPSSRNSVVEQILERIRLLIATGKFRAGEKLPSEFELMEELSVGRNSLREAMKILAAIGVVDIRRGDGTYLCSKVQPNFIDSIAYSVLLESSSAEELIELRQTLDEDVLHLAIKKCTEDDICQMQQMIDCMREHFAAGRISEAAQEDIRFHCYMMHCTQNRFLERMVLGIYNLFAVSIEQNIRTEELFAQADEHHQAMLNCIKARDSRLVESVIAQSLSSWRRGLKDKMQTQQSL